jgi:1,4-alpha-glucan branching enzyme
MFMRKSKNQLNQKLNSESQQFPTRRQNCDVDFVLECNGAEQVFVCGDFNDWHPTSLRMIGNPDMGLWEKRLVLPPGRHEYKFIVDGKWLHDPDARENVRNIHGSLNSVVEVSPWSPGSK